MPFRAWVNTLIFNNLSIAISMTRKNEIARNGRFAQSCKNSLTESLVT